MARRHAGSWCTRSPVRAKWCRNSCGHQAAAAIPADRLLLETDAPDLPPVVRQPDGTSALAAAPNAPENLVPVLHWLASLRGSTPATLARQTWENACRLFGTPLAPVG